MCRAHQPRGEVWDLFYAHPCSAGGRTLTAEQSRWHPLLAAQEGPTGTWSLLDAFDRVYGTIELRRVSATDLRYRPASAASSSAGQRPSASRVSRCTPSSYEATAPTADRSPTGARPNGSDRPRCLMPPRCPPRRGSREPYPRPCHRRSKAAKHRGSRGAGSARELLQAPDQPCGRARCSALR